MENIIIIMLTLDYRTRSKIVFESHFIYLKIFLCCSVLFQQKKRGDEPNVFLDPNKWSEDGTIALSQKSFSDDGNYMAYGISENGSDWLKIKIRDVKSGDDLKETLEKVKFSEISWTLDNKGFFYAVRHPYKYL